MKQVNKFSILGVILASVLACSAVQAQAGNVAWNVSVGGGYGGWRPVAYGPGWGHGWGPGWRIGVTLVAITALMLATMLPQWFMRLRL